MCRRERGKRWKRGNPQNVGEAEFPFFPAFPYFPFLCCANVINDADDGVIDRDELDGQRQRGLAAGDEEYQFTGAGLGGPIGRDDRFAHRLLLLVQWLDD